MKGWSLATAMFLLSLVEHLPSKFLSYLDHIVHIIFTFFIFIALALYALFEHNIAVLFEWDVWRVVTLPVTLIMLGAAFSEILAQVEICIVPEFVLPTSVYQWSLDIFCGSLAQFAGRNKDEGERKPNSLLFEKLKELIDIWYLWTVTCLEFLQNILQAMKRSLLQELFDLAEQVYPQFSCNFEDFDQDFYLSRSIFCKSSLTVHSRKTSLSSNIGRLSLRWGSSAGLATGGLPIRWLLTERRSGSARGWRRPSSARRSSWPRLRIGKCQKKKEKSGNFHSWHYLI